MASSTGKSSENDIWMSRRTESLWQQSVDCSELCDVVITLEDGKELKAHWCILVLCPFFEALNRSEMLESASGTINLSHFDVSTVQFILKYMYTGHWDLGNQCKESVIELADFLLLQNLKAHLEDGDLTHPQDGDLTHPEDCDQTHSEDSDLTHPEDHDLTHLEDNDLSSYHGSMFLNKSSVDKQWLVNCASALWKQCLDNAPYCDVIIKAKEWQFSAHRCVLSVCPYFETMFTNGNKGPDSGVVDLSEVGQELVKFTLEYIYSGILELTLSNIESILKLASVLDIETLLTQARQYCMESIDEDHCLQIRSLAKRLNLDEVCEIAETYLYEQFSRISKTSAILDVSYDDLMGFVTDLKLSYFTPAEFFELIVSWVKHAMNERLGYFDELFSAIKLELIALDDMAKVKENEYVKNSAVCIAAVNKYESDSKEGRINPGLKDVVVVCGSYYGNKHFVYSIGEERWVRLPIPSLYFPKNYMTVVDEQIYLFDRHVRGDLVLQLHAYSESWRHHQLMEFNCYGLENMAVVSCAGYICCVSGNKRYIKLYPTRPSLRYRYVEMAVLKDPCIVSAFAMKDEAILIVGKGKGRRRNRVDLCLLYNIRASEFSQYPLGARYGEFMCCDESGGKVFVFQSGCSCMFDYTDRQWKKTNCYIPPPEGLKHKGALIGTYYKDQVYVAVGGQSNGSLVKGQLYRYKNGWEKLTQMPVELYFRARPVMMKISAFSATCPPHCPHCDFLDCSESHSTETYCPFCNSDWIDCFCG